MHGRELYAQMRQDGFDPVITTMMREQPELDERHAQETLNAFLQWFSVIPLLETGQRIQMLESVDPAWHAFILNTRLYREFCERYFSRFIDHDPMDPLNQEIPREQYAAFTLALLRREFGDDVHPELLRLDQPVTCCIGCGGGK